jgi:hypothetical protein
MIKFIRRAIAVCFLLAASVSAYAAPLNLPPLEYVFDATLIADMATTLDIRKHPGFVEDNPILGRNPSDAKIYRYFGASALIHAGVTSLLEHIAPRWVPAWEASGIALELGCVGHNYSIGLRMRI